MAFKNFPDIYVPDDHNSLAQSYQAYDPSPVVVLLAT